MEESYKNKEKTIEQLEEQGKGVEEIKSISVKYDQMRKEGNQKLKEFFKTAQQDETEVSFEKLKEEAKEIMKQYLLIN